MNVQNLINQINSNPMNLLMGALSPQQKQSVNLFKNKTSQQQAEEIANFCNQNGINKQQFTELINMFRR